MGTREKILETAIDLFAERGYSDVSIRDITRAVGIKESSLYNHFSSKQQLLEEIFAFLSSQYEGMNIPEEEAVRFIEGMNPQAFMEMCLMNFQLYFGNPKLIKIWRIISMERFRNEQANDFLIKHLVDYPLAYQTKVFEGMRQKGLIGDFDPQVLARAFYAFILFVYMRYFEDGRHENPAGDKEVRDMIKAHMDFLGQAMKQKTKPD